MEGQGRVCGNVWVWESVQVSFRWHFVSVPPISYLLSAVGPDSNPKQAVSWEVCESQITLQMVKYKKIIRCNCFVFFYIFLNVTRVLLGWGLLDQKRAQGIFGHIFKVQFLLLINQ